VAQLNRVAVAAPAAVACRHWRWRPRQFSRHQQLMAPFKHPARSRPPRGAETSGTSRNMTANQKRLVRAKIFPGFPANFSGFSRLITITKSFFRLMVLKCRGTACCARIGHCSQCPYKRNYFWQSLESAGGIFVPPGAGRIPGSDPPDASRPSATRPPGARAPERDLRNRRGPGIPPGPSPAAALRPGKPPNPPGRTCRSSPGP
jgi:hypothetical protein